ncbi:DNA-directed RNA polymerase subunit P [Candidatus Woesearchaeota archaeon]|nr:MAG: DNA-directed RNA polymerase subunit P [Candidatus Woesearchaeota archaeon]
MSNYKCFQCNKVIKDMHIKRRVRCVYCGSKIVFKERSTATTVVAR